MAASIGKGDWVERILVSDCPEENAEMPLHSLLCVESVLPSPFGCDYCDSGQYPALKLAENPADDWCACAYRPVYRPRADIIESLKAPPKVVPVRESEAA